jgi:hypothetical protein
MSTRREVLLGFYSNEPAQRINFPLSPQAQLPITRLSHTKPRSNDLFNTASQVQDVHICQNDDAPPRPSMLPRLGLAHAPCHRAGKGVPALRPGQPDAHGDRTGPDFLHSHVQWHARWHRQSTSHRNQDFGRHCHLPVPEPRRQRRAWADGPGARRQFDTDYLKSKPERKEASRSPRTRRRSRWRICLATAVANPSGRPSIPSLCANPSTSRSSKAASPPIASTAPAVVSRPARTPSPAPPSQPLSVIQLSYPPEFSSGQL